MLEHGYRTLLFLSVFSTILLTAAPTPVRSESVEQDTQSDTHGKQKKQVITRMGSVGPHGGHIVESKEHQFEVKLEPEKKVVKVYTLRSTSQRPNALKVVLYETPTIAHHIDLKAVDLTQTLPQFVGQLSVANTSYVGIGIHITP